MREFKDSITGKDDDDELVHDRLASRVRADEHPVAYDPVAAEQRERDTVA